MPPSAAGQEARVAGPKVPAPAKPTRARRRPAVIALGLALVALGILASVYLTTTLGQTHKVLAVTSNVARGDMITPSDLAPVDLPTGPTLLDPVDASLLEEVVDQFATVDLPAGSLLTADSYAASLQPGEGRSIVGIALNPNQMPATSLAAGDQVRIIETPVSGGDAPVEDPFAIPAAIVTVKEATVGDQTVVDVDVARNQAAALAARAASGRVALVLDAAPAGGNAATDGSAPSTGGDAPTGAAGSGDAGAANGEAPTDGNG
ncbi:hypothetical protein EDD34_0036 [Myceligenerans xiligouense]|uniref:SAF domain-containing protein n=2 Tax=Myceligenerans xiligouense TaxID=253184 RepID=A0A3N4Z004_9MICO|nr:hypothetical protein EDD34_0036 [Myceligenerans xiligouense]